MSDFNECFILRVTGMNGLFSLSTYECTRTMLIVNRSQLEQAKYNAITNFFFVSKQLELKRIRYIWGELLDCKTNQLWNS